MKVWMSLIKWIAGVCWVEAAADQPGHVCRHLSRRPLEGAIEPTTPPAASGVNIETRGAEEPPISLFYPISAFRWQVGN